MRILFILHCYMPDSIGGTEVHVNLLARALKLEHDVAICYRVAHPGIAEFTLERGNYEGVPTYAIVNNYTWSISPEKAYFCPQVESTFKHVLDDFQPDLVHFHHLSELSTTLPKIVKERGIPMALTLHDFWPMCYRSYLMTPMDELCPGPNEGQRCKSCWQQDYANAGSVLSYDSFSRIPGWGVRGTLKRLPGALRKLISRSTLESPNHFYQRDVHFRQVLQQFDALWAPSRFLRDRIARWANLSDGIDYIPNGVNPDNLVGYDPLLPDAPRLQIGFVGTVSRHKGAEVLIEAMNRLIAEPVDCYIYGSARKGDGPEYVAGLKKRLINPSVRFMGRVPNTEIGHVLSGLDVLVVPSVWWENCPMTILEAQYARRPVITTNIGGMAELVHDGKNGLTFAPGDAEALAEAIKRLAHDRELLHRLQQGITPPPAMADVAAEILTRYETLLAQHGERRI